MSAPRRAPALRLAAAAVPGVGLDEAARLAVAWDRVRAAAEARAALVLLPEAALTGYHTVPGDPAHAERARQALARWAAETGLWIAAGLVDGDSSALDLVAPDGRRWTYRKRYPTWSEARAWAPGRSAVVADTELGRVALLICADILQPAASRDLGPVDLVLVAAAWSDHAGPPRAPRPLGAALAPAFRRSLRWRDAVLPALARQLGAPLAWANATGERAPGEAFTGDPAIYGADGRCLSRGDPRRPLAVATASPGCPGPPLRWPVSLRAFSAAHRLGVALRRGAVRWPG